MNKNVISFMRGLMTLTDAIIVIGSYIIAFIIRNLCFSYYYGTVGYYRIYVWMLIAIIPIWLLVFYITGLYNIEKKENFLKTALKIVLSVGIGSVLLSAVLYFLKEHSISRLFILIFSSVDILLTILFRRLAGIILQAYYSRKRNRTRMLVVGTNSMATRFTAYVNENPQLMIDIIGYLRAGEKVHSGDLKIIGKLDDLREVLINNVVDEVVFALPRDYQGEVGPYVMECRNKGVNVNMLADLFDFNASNVRISTIGSLPVITLYAVPADAGRLFVKRLMDIAGALIGLAITGIAFIIFAPLIKLESSGPVFFSQDRVGRNGRIFRCYKFRSMYNDAEERKKELLKYNQMNGAIFKIKDDPRVTRVGKFMRALSIDELPQFWNVFKGDMSLVGTRPPTVDEVRKYQSYHWKRLSIKPGLTGLWQTSGRNKVRDFEDIVRLDTEYIDHWSLGLDIKLIFKTLQSVIARDGAY